MVESLVWVQDGNNNSNEYFYGVQFMLSVFLY